MRTGLLFCLLLLFSCAATAQEDDSTIATHGNIYQDTLAPRFDVYDIKGNHWTTEDLKGKVIVLNFWSIYCSPCIAELPELNKLPSKFSSDSVVFISVVFEKTPRADSIIARHLFNYHLVEGGLPIQGDFYNNCFPTQIIIDAQGYIRFNICGTVNANAMEEEIRKVQQRSSAKSTDSPRK